jgi:hypothetical protein
MAKRLAIPSKELQLHVVSKLGTFKAPRIQRITLGTDVPSTTVDEIGNSAHVGDVKDTPNITLTFSAFDVGVSIFRALTGSAAAYPAAGVDIVNLGEIDAVLFVKDPSIADYVKSGHAKRLQIRDFAFSYSADGEATEDYTAIGSEKRWFSNDVVVESYATAGPTFALSNTPVPLKNGRLALSVILDGSYLTEIATGGTPATGEYKIAGTTLTVFDTVATKIVVVYQAAPAGTNWADVSDTVQPAAVRGKDIPISIGANSLKRVQSVSINGTLNTQPVKELGNKVIVGYQRQNPEVTGSISVLDTDTEMLNLLTAGTTTTSGITEWQPGEGCATGTLIDLKIEILDPCDTTSPYTVLKTVYLDSIGIVGDSYTGTVNQNTVQNFDFKSLTGHCCVYSGAKP